MAVATSVSFTIFSLFRTTHQTRRMSIKPLTKLSSTGHKMKMAVQYELKEGQNRQFHELPSGLKMEVISQKKKVVGEGERESKGSPPLVFIHGSFHGAWCWAEHWLPFFSNHGFDCHALSLLAQVLISAILIIFFSNF